MPALVLSDSDCLDFLDSLEAPPGFGWKVWRSTTGRGWRLATTREEPNFPTAREAIGHAMVEFDEIIGAYSSQGFTFDIRGSSE